MEGEHLDFRLPYPYNPTITATLPRKRKEARPRGTFQQHPTLPARAIVGRSVRPRKEIGPV
jgi:hypothetical protein